LIFIDKQGILMMDLQRFPLFSLSSCWD